MFQLFNKIKPRTEKEIIKEIHNSFDIAEDKLLKEAEDMLESLNITTETKLEEKAERLEKIGFINSKHVVKNKEIKQKIQKNQESLVKTKQFADLIRYYKREYPFQKFLTEKELNSICDKYSLIYASINNYIEDVPEKNILDIEKAKTLKEEDILKDYYEVSDFTFCSGATTKYKNFIKENIINKEYPYSDITERNIVSHIRNLGFKEDIGSNFYFNSASVKKIDKSGLFIVAPKSHFNLKNISKESKYGYFTTTITKINDPIVFRYCKGGIQVITKWGLANELNKELTLPIEN